MRSWKEFRRSLGLFSVLLALSTTIIYADLQAQISDKIRVTKKEGREVWIDGGENKGVKKREYYEILQGGEKVDVIRIVEVDKAYSKGRIMGDPSKIKVGAIVRKETTSDAFLMTFYSTIPVKYETFSKGNNKRIKSEPIIRLRFGTGELKPFLSIGLEFGYLLLDNSSTAYQVDLYLSLPVAEHRPLFLYLGLDGGYAWIAQEKETDGAWLGDVFGGIGCYVSSHFTVFADIGYSFYKSADDWGAMVPYSKIDIGGLRTGLGVAFSWEWEHVE